MKIKLKHILGVMALLAFTIPVAYATTIQTTVDPHREGEDSSGYFTTTTGVKTPELWVGPSGSEVQMFAPNSTPANITAAGGLTAVANAGRVNTVNSAAGIALTLPASTGSGNSYTLYIGTTVTSIGTTIATIGSDKIAGNAYQTGATGAATAFLAAGAGTTVTLNGTTKGGIKGDIVKFRDISAGLYSVEIEESITGTAATPFS